MPENLGNPAAAASELSTGRTSFFGANFSAGGLPARFAASAFKPIVQRVGPEMLSMLRGDMMGENKARFGNAIEEMVDCGRQSQRSSQLRLI